MIMHTSTDKNTDFSPLIESIRGFYDMLKSTDWFLDSQRDHIRDCILSARDVERIFEHTEQEGVSTYFESILEFNEFSRKDTCQLHKACDLVLEKILTAAAIPYVNVRSFLDSYIEICGAERLASILSSTVFQSEVYRVIWDFIAGSAKKEQVGVLLQAHILCGILENNSELGKNQTLWYNWLLEDSACNNMATALHIIGDDQAQPSVTTTFSTLLISALQKRNEVAVQFWETIMTNPKVLSSLTQSHQLLETALNFLKISGQWMEATENLEWVSRETGPCQKFVLCDIASVLKCLLQSKYEVLHQAVMSFMLKRRNCLGCTFWDDVHMKIIDSSIIRNV